MAKKIGYFFKGYEEAVEDAEYFKEICIGKGTIPKRLKELLVKQACEHAWGHRFRRGWLRNGEIVTLVIDGVEAGDFDITVEAEPVFTVIEIKKERDGERCG